jgi:GxxExxY protein
LPKKELVDAGLKVEQQKILPIIYKGVPLETGYRIDLLVEEQIILELKAVETMSPVYQAQL